MFFQRYKYMSYTEQKRNRLKILRILLIICVIFLLQLIIRTYLLSIYRIGTTTMQPTISSGDMIIAVRAGAAQHNLQRGDLVFVDPAYTEKQSFFKTLIRNSALFATFQLAAPFKPVSYSHNQPFLRRVVGIPGDTLYMESFITYIKPKNGNYFLTEFEIGDAQYNVNINTLPEKWNNGLPFSGTYPTILLKENEYFVLCDNRIASGDSRLWGPVNSLTRTMASVIMRYWPITKVTFF